MNSLKKKLIMAAAVATFAVNAIAGVDLQTINIEQPLPAATAHQLLDKVLLHNPAALDTVKVEISDIQHRNLFSVAFLYVGRGNNGFPTEIYVVTLDKKGNFVDGALLGILGDVRSLVIDREREMRYEPKNAISYELTGDTIKAKRAYTFFSTLRGGRPFEKKGTIYNRFIIKGDGTLQQLSPEATAIETRGSRPAGLPEPRDGKPVVDEKMVRTVKGEYDGYGMNVLMMMQTPVSAFDMTRVNNMAMWADKVNARPNSTDDYNVAMVAMWGSALCLRHADVSLPWLAANPNQDLLANCLVNLAEEDATIGSWLTQCVKALKDKKARKWWLNALK